MLINIKGLGVGLLRKKRYLFLLVVGVLLADSAVLWWGNVKIQQLAPPVGFTYERLAPVSGIYKSSHSLSAVGGQEISCEVPAIVAAGTKPSSNSCWMVDELNGRMVTVDQIRARWCSLGFWLEKDLVVRIESEGKVYFSRDDAVIREQWITESKARGLGFVLIWFFLCPLLFGTIAIKKM